jgi:hypothetical protein
VAISVLCFAPNKTLFIMCCEFNYVVILAKRFRLKSFIIELLYCKINCHTAVEMFNFLYFLEFRSGRAPILVATDVAARGLGEFCV